MRIIAGNCLLEDINITCDTVHFLKEKSEEYKFDLIYKSSYLKDNRSDLSYSTGPGYDECVMIFNAIKNVYKVPILTDFSYPEDLQTDIVDYVDIIQIPAYLCMQNILVQAAANTGKIINIKKGQFLHPDDINHIIKKITDTMPYCADRIWLTERGACFGYRDLIVDPRSIDILKRTGHPVFVDIGHACRKYGIPSCDVKHGGMKEFVIPLAKTAIALGAHLFVEVHPNPAKAACDAATQLSFDEFEFLMDEVGPLKEWAEEWYPEY